MKITKQLQLKQKLTRKNTVCETATPIIED